jgi:hypothetical protein
MTSALAQIIIVVLFGCLFLGVGLAIRFGYWKSWYWRNVRMIHGYIPLGILIILFGFNDLARERLGSNYVVYQAVTISIFLVGAWWSIRPPKLMIPEWVNWIETHPRKVVVAMIKAAREGQDWKSKVQSKKSVDAWARALKKTLPKKTK